MELSFAEGSGNASLSVEVSLIRLDSVSVISDELSFASAGASDSAGMRFNTGKVLLFVPHEAAVSKINDESIIAAIFFIICASVYEYFVGQYT